MWSSLLLAGLVLALAEGFATYSVVGNGYRSYLAPTMSASGGSNKSYADRLREAQASKAGGRPTASQSAPAQPQVQPRATAAAMSFTADIETHLQTAIALLSTRLYAGKPLDRSQFEQLEASIAAIMADALPHVGSAPATAPAPVAASSAAAAAFRPPVIAAPQEAVEWNDDDEENESEGRAWDPKEGYGVPTGTKNTYKIEGMDGMSPDEYQEALRARVVKRAQAARASGSYGNRAANAYLDFLRNKPTWDIDESKLEPKEDFNQY